ncbi:MAG: Minf_1886 family protein [Blastopirellula sp. JB062]
MTDETYSDFMRMLKEDPRFKLEAYQFVREALSFGQNLYELESDDDEDLDIDDEMLLEDEEFDDDDDDDEAEDWTEPERHLTGQMLCEAIRSFALQQYGLMAKTVLNSWGVETTGHFGDIVYNLIDIGMMKKSPQDRREDFDDVYDFDVAFVRDFRIEVTEESSPR